MAAFWYVEYNYKGRRQLGKNIIVMGNLVFQRIKHFEAIIKDRKNRTNIITVSSSMDYLFVAAVQEAICQCNGIIPTRQNMKSFAGETGSYVCKFAE